MHLTTQKIMPKLVWNNLFFFLVTKLNKGKEKRGTEKKKKLAPDKKGS
jgi:ferric iron reductase protein FhuF